MKKFNLDITEFKKIFVVLIVTFVTVVLLSYIIFGKNTKDLTSKNKNKLPEWAQDKPQNKDEIKDIRVAMPYVSQNYIIRYINTKDLYNVEYNPKLGFDEIEVEVVLWFKENTNLSEVTIKFGDLGGVTKTYDLTKDIKDILPDNEFVKIKKDAPYFTEETLM